MIAPVNCNPDCDCAQRLVRCQKAVELEWRDGHWVVVREMASIDKEEEMRPPRASKMKMEEILAVTEGDACAVTPYFKLETKVSSPRERLIHAFRTCSLDCAMWSDNALDQLADLALTVLERPIIDGPPNESGDVT